MNEDIDDLIPVRALNQVSYCPRLYFLEYVEAVLYLQEPGAHVGRRAEHLVITVDSVQINKVPIASIRQVVVFGNVQVSTQVLHVLAEQEMSGEWRVASVE